LTILNERRKIRIRTAMLLMAISHRITMRKRVKPRTTAITPTTRITTDLNVIITEEETIRQKLRITVKKDNI
jgi:hypothetical protein